MLQRLRMLVALQSQCPLLVGSVPGVARAAVHEGLIADKGAVKRQKSASFHMHVRTWVQVRSVRFEGCTLESAEDAALTQPDAFVAHVSALLGSVFAVDVQGGTPYKCCLSRRLSIGARDPEP